MTIKRSLIGDARVPGNHPGFRAGRALIAARQILADCGQAVFGAIIAKADICVADSLAPFFNR
jgi:hypothetical protein